MSARVGGGVDITLSLSLLNAFDQSVFKGFEGPAGPKGDGGVLAGQLGGAIREQAAEVASIARGSSGDSQDMCT